MDEPKSPPRCLTVIGLMSGTSLDGIDCAVIETDGRVVRAVGPAATTPYDTETREALRAVLGRRGRDHQVEAAERLLTEAHAEAVRAMIAAHGPVDLVGFHGQTLFHDPADGLTLQIGDGALLAQRVGVTVAADFRTADVAAGGQGAPLAPLYHAALAGPLEKPLAVLNLGGVGNVTWIGEGGDEILAFDTGPGNALLDDWCRERTGAGCDLGGRLALAGQVDGVALAVLLTHDYFRKSPPKSLDRDDFAAWVGQELAGRTAEDGAALLTGFTAGSVARAAQFFPAPPRRWLVTGGGRRNPAMMAALSQALEAPVEAVEAVGWDGDALEAQAFAYLAARVRTGLPLSLPTTTGVAAPTPGGRLFTV